MRDPYAVLGIAKTADEKQIKSAFRKLAMKYHPDHNKDDKTAQAKFAEINQAYEILGDKDKRAQFDRGEIDAEGKPRFGPGMGAGFGAGGSGAGFGGGARGFEGFDFGDLGGGRRQSGGFRGGGINLDDLGDIFGGAFGGGKGSFGRGGPGNFGARAPRKGADIAATLTVSLAQLAGAEKVEVAFSDGKRLKIKLPSYLEDGQTIRLKGQGQQIPGGVSGDALITVRFQPDARFRIEGRALHTDLPISLKKAVLGGKQSLQTLDGAVALTIPAWVSSGKVLRLAERGLPEKAGGRAPLYVHLQIELPAGKDPRLEELMQTYPD